MKFSVILMVFISFSMTVFGQSVYEQGNGILTQNNIHSQCRTYTQTPDGIYIGTRSSANKPVNYLYKDGNLTLVKSLESYTIFAFSPTTGNLVIGAYSKKFTDVSCYELSTYYLPTKSIKKLVNYSTGGYSGIYNVSLNGDTLTCIVNVKRTGEVGSDLIAQYTLLK